MKIRRFDVGVSIAVPDDVPLPTEQQVTEVFHTALDVITPEEFTDVDDFPVWDFCGVVVNDRPRVKMPELTDSGLAGWALERLMSFMEVEGGDQALSRLRDRAAY